MHEDEEFLLLLLTGIGVAQNGIQRTVDKFLSNTVSRVSKKWDEHFKWITLNPESIGLLLSFWSSPLPKNALTTSPKGPAEAFTADIWSDHILG